jgi:hypothetical protein
LENPSTVTQKSEKQVTTGGVVTCLEWPTFKGRIGLFTLFLKPKALVFLCRKEAECGGCSNFKRDLAWKIDVGTANGSERVKSSF